jgi:cardiolipin synthase
MHTRRGEMTSLLKVAGWVALNHLTLIFTPVYIGSGIPDCAALARACDETDGRIHMTNRMKAKLIASETDHVLTLSNQLTLVRMGMIPVFILLVMYGKLGWALIVFLVAGLTDMLDGWLARWLHQRTVLGTYLDPIADKLLLTASFVTLTFQSMPVKNHIPIWATVIFLSRDVIIVVSSLIIYIATGFRNFWPSIYGKITTVLQLAAVLTSILFSYLDRTSPLARWAVYAAVASTVFSGIHYVVLTRRRLGESTLVPASSSAPPEEERELRRRAG